MQNLDLKDWKILEELADNARQSHNLIGKAVGLSKNAVTYRIKRLENAGIIKGYFATISLSKLGYSSFNVLMRLNASSEQEKEFIEHLKNHPGIITAETLIGEWNFIADFCYKNLNEFNQSFKELRRRFADIIDTYEVHTFSEVYAVKQLPIIMTEKKSLLEQKKEEKIDIDQTDIMLLNRLNKNSTATLLELSKNLNLTYQTVAARIKKLQAGGVIRKFTAKIGLHALGYEVYLTLISLHNLTKEKESSLRSYINDQKNVRFAFMSANSPKLFIHVAVKNASELQTFFNDFKQKFSDIIISYEFLLSQGQIKYELLPKI